MRTETTLFDAVHVPLEKGINLVEASAGTGKTYAIAMLALRAVVELGIPVDQLLIVTFTKAAAGELRERIRNRLAEARDLLDERGTKPDQTLVDWAKKIGDLAQALDRLRLALYDIDRAGIFTIHSFCRKMLQEQALESGQLFDVELLADIGEIRTQVVDDFWRSHIYTLAPRPCSVVTAVFAAPEDLAASIRGVEAAAAVEPAPGGIATAVSAFEQAFSAMSRWWQAEADRLRAFLLGAIGEQKFKKDLRDGFVTWWRDCDAFFRGESFDVPERLDYLTRDGLSAELNGTKLKGQGAKDAFLDAAHLPEEAVTGLIRSADALLLTLRGNLAALLVDEVGRRLTRSGAMSFDDLVLRLSDAIDRGGKLPELVGRRYRVALIDEFQDTDSRQWHIFRSLFGGGNHYLYLIGDPKQAIYKFRGADIFSYFQARKAAGKRLSLDRNYRSHPELVAEVNRLFTCRPRPFSFAEDVLDYAPVAPAKKLEDGHLEHDGERLPAMLYCQLPETEAGAWTSGKAATAIRHFVVAEVLDLLDLSRPVRLVTAKDGGGPLQPHHIAVLVRSNAQAQDYLEAFAEARIPAVVASRQSIFSTEACRETILVLEAVAAPGDLQRLKTAMTVSWFDLTGDELQRIWRDEAAFDGWHGRFQQYFRVWREQGFLTMMTRLLDDERVLVHLAKERIGQRHIANIRHLMELIQTAESTENLGPGRTLQWLRLRTASEVAGEDVELRLESDDEAVRIVTMHSAKGLEYPVVFCPYLWSRSTRQLSERWVVGFHDDEQRLVLDLGSEKFPERRQQAADEEFAEDLRVAYVALTRARVRCYAFWAEVKGSSKTARSFDSALGYLLFPAGPVDFQAQRLALQALSRPGCVEHRLLTDDGLPLSPYAPDTGNRLPLAPLPPSARSLVTDWQTSSYSAMAMLGERDEENRFIAGSPEEGGAPILCPGLPAGANFGNVVHNLLEMTPFSAIDEGRDLDDEIGRQCARYGVQADKGDLRRLLAHIVATPLSASDGPALALLDDRRCAREMPFSFHPDRIATDRVNAVLASDPAVTPLAPKVMRGYLTGFVDLFFEFQGRYFILDYKTNYLGDRIADYAPENLVRAMAAHNYGLQYWLYTLVLHRHLQNVRPDYAYRRHFGGVFYLFVRGMDPARPGSGVFSTVPDETTLARLSACMEDGYAG